MFNWFGMLIVLATLTGVVWVTLSAVWLLKRASLTTLKRIAFGFICLGALIPAVILLLWKWAFRHGNFAAEGWIQGIAIWLWPTSIELMALDSPEPQAWSGIAMVYAVSILGNIGIYGVAGFIVGWLAASVKRAT
jgi:hypothetical protein